VGALEYWKTELSSLLTWAGGVDVPAALVTGDEVLDWGADVGAGVEVVFAAVDVVFWSPDGVVGFGTPCACTAGATRKRRPTRPVESRILKSSVWSWLWI